MLWDCFSAKRTGQLIPIKKMNGVLFSEIFCMEELAKIPAVVCANRVKTYRKHFTYVIASLGYVTKY